MGTHQRMLDAAENIPLTTVNTGKDTTTMHEQQQQATHFQQMDKQKFGRFHVRAVLVSGVGFFTDAYDLFIINMVVPMLGYVYYSQQGNKIPSYMDGVVKGSATVGTFVGQILFGYLADRYGRKKMYGLELIIMIIATIGCALSANTVRGIDALTMLSIWRFVLGVGIGGDYPLSAVITSEFASIKHRGSMIAAVFAMQGVGILVASLVAITTLSIFKSLIEQDQLYIDYVWRLCLGLGCVPAACALYSRLTIPETPRFTAAVTGDHEQARKDAETVLRMNRSGEVATTSFESGQTTDTLDPILAPVNNHTTFYRDFRAHFGKWRNGKALLGCMISWFALDVAFYGINLNQSIVLNAIGYSPKGASPFDTLFSLGVGNMMIALMGTVPGYWISVALIEKMGRIRIQVMGFVMLTILFVILAAAYNSLLATSIPLFIFLFTLAQLFFNFGPNVTTFVIPGELFPTRFRSTAHGMSAAAGKSGAIMATYAFTPLKDIGGVNAFMPQVLGIFAVFMFVGLCATALVPEPKGMSLDQMEDSDITPVAGQVPNKVISPTLAINSDNYSSASNMQIL